MVTNFILFCAHIIGAYNREKNLLKPSNEIVRLYEYNFKFVEFKLHVKCVVSFAKDFITICFKNLV